MTLQFTKNQQEAIRVLLGSTADLGTDFSAPTSCLQIDAVQDLLDLPPLPYREFLGRDCWLAGGGILRWLANAQEQNSPFEGDYDFFFSSLDGLNRTAAAMVERGFEVRGYQALAQNISEYLRGTMNDAPDSPIWGRDHRLVQLTPHLVQQLRLAYLELLSPTGDAIQLVTSCYQDPLATIERFDLSVCQLISDDRYLSFGPWTWSDLMHKRMRSVHISRPDASFQRIFRYARRGFRPYPRTALKVSQAFLRHLVQVPKLYARPKSIKTIDLFR